MSCMDPLYGKELQKVKDALGAERLVFGTGICFREPEPALVRMEALVATDQAKEQIYSANLAALLGE